MANFYYYLVAGLPQLSIGEAPVIETDSLLSVIEDNLSEDDYSLFQTLTLENDNKNLTVAIQKAYSKRPSYDRFFTPSKYSEDEIKSFADKSHLERYMIRFIEDNENRFDAMNEEEIEVGLLRYFYEEVTNLNNEFLSGFYSFERDLKNIIAAYNARKYNRPIEEEVVTPSVVASSLIHSTSADFSLSQSHPFIAEIMNAFNSEDIETLEDTITSVLWNYIDSATTFEYFSASGVYAYYLKHKLVRRKYSLDAEEGKKRLEEIIMKMKESYKIPQTH